MALLLSLVAGGTIYVLLTNTDLAGFFLRASYAQTPVQGVIATLIGAAVMPMVYAAISGKLERRTVSELALRPMAKELAIGAALGAGRCSLCIVMLMMLGNYTVTGFNALAVVPAEYGHQTKIVQADGPRMPLRSSPPPDRGARRAAAECHGRRRENRDGRARRRDVGHRRPEPRPQGAHRATAEQGGWRGR